MRFAPIGAAKTFFLDLPQRPSAAGTFVVKGVSGGILQASSAPTLNAVDTTLAANAAVGTALTLTSGTGVTAGRRYLLGGAAEVGGEQVTVKARTGAAVTLLRPLRSAYAASSTFQSTRVEFTVSTSCTQAPGRNLRIEYTWPEADGQDPVVIPFDVTRYTPQANLGIESLRDLDPLLAKRLNTGVWLPGVVEIARAKMYRDIAQNYAPGALAGTVDLDLALNYLVRALLAETAGDDDEMTAYRERMERRYAQERDGACAIVAFDEKQTGAARNDAGYSRTIHVIRG
jgi:hypothetical protein